MDGQRFSLFIHVRQDHQPAGGPHGRLCIDIGGWFTAPQSVVLQGSAHSATRFPIRPGDAAQGDSEVDQALDDLSLALSSDNDAAVERRRPCLEAIGAAIFEALFPAGEMLDLWRRCCEIMSLHSNMSSLRLVIAAEPALGWLPFEVLHDPEHDFLALQGISIVRTALHRSQFRTLQFERHVQHRAMSVCIVCPVAEGKTPFTQEPRQVRRQLESAGIPVELHEGGGTGPSLAHHVRRPQQMLHFSGHCVTDLNSRLFREQSLSAHLLLCNYDGSPVRMGAGSFVDTLLQSELAVAYLNACWSARMFTTVEWDAAAPRALALLGMQFSVAPKLATECPHDVYLMMLRGVSLEDAVVRVRAMRGPQRDWAQLVLFVPWGRLPVWPAQGMAGPDATDSAVTELLAEIDLELAGTAPDLELVARALSHLNKALLKCTGKRRKQVIGLAAASLRRCEQRYMPQRSVEVSRLLELWRLWTQLLSPSKVNRSLEDDFVRAWEHHIERFEAESARAAERLAIALDTRNQDYLQQLGSARLRRAIAVICEVMFELRQSIEALASSPPSKQRRATRSRTIVRLRRLNREQAEDCVRCAADRLRVAEDLLWSLSEVGSILEAQWIGNLRSVIRRMAGLLQVPVRQGASEDHPCSPPDIKLEGRDARLDKFISRLPHQLANMEADGVFDLLCLRHASAERARRRSDAPPAAGSDIVSQPLALASHAAITEVILKGDSKQVLAINRLAMLQELSKSGYTQFLAINRRGILLDLFKEYFQNVPVVTRLGAGTGEINTDVDLQDLLYTILRSTGVDASSPPQQLPTVGQPSAGRATSEDDPPGDQAKEIYSIADALGLTWAGARGEVMGRPTTIFISYRGAQIHYASWLDKLLRMRGFDTFFQPSDFEVGQSIQGNMKIGSERDWTVAVVTEDYFESPYTLAEWTAALAADRLIPLAFAPLERIRHSGELTDISSEVLADLDHAAMADAIEARIDQRTSRRQGWAADPPLVPACPTNLAPERERFFFSGRRAALSTLQNVLRTKRRSGELVLLSGGPGLGKSRLAEKCGAQLAANGQFGAVFVVPDASTPESIEGSLAQLALVIGPDYTPEALPNQARRMHAFVDWLQSHRRWLLIADGVDSMAALQALERAFPARERRGLLAVSRRGDLVQCGADLTLQQLDPDEGATFLLEAIPRDERWHAPARRIAEAVSGRPAVLAWVARWIRERDMPMDLDHPVWAAWFDGLSQGLPGLFIALLRELERLTQPARRIAKTLCLLDGSPVPMAVFTDRRADAGAADTQLDAAVAELVASPLCEKRGGCINADPVVAEFVRRRMEDADTSELRTFAAGFFVRWLGAAGHPSDQRSWVFWQALRPALRALFTASGLHRWPPPIVQLGAHYAIYLLEMGALAEAQNMLELLEIAGAGEDDGTPRQAYREALARLHLEARRPDLAIAQLEPAVATVAADDEDAASRARLDNLMGYSLQLVGDLVRAEAFYRQAISCLDDVSATSPELRLQCESNLAGCLADAGKLAEAQALARRAWIQGRHHFGEQHPVAAGLQANYATLLEPVDAGPLLRSALQTLERTGQGRRTAAANIMRNLVAMGCASSDEEERQWLDRARDIDRA